MQEQCKVKIMPLHDNFVMPTKQFDSACYDVVATSIENNFDRVTCKLGFATEIPEGWKGVIVPRSNITKSRWSMLNSPGQVDCDYRGEWIVKFQGIPEEPFNSNFPYKVGDRVAQIYFERVNPVEFELVDKLEESQRGSGGFGSTGK